MDWGHDTISIRRQCGLLGINRASLYYAPRGESEENLRLMRWIDEQYTRAPFFGSRRIAAWLRKEKKADVNRKRVARLMQVEGLKARVQKRFRSTTMSDHDQPIAHQAKPAKDVPLAQRNAPGLGKVSFGQQFRKPLALPGVMAGDQHLLVAADDARQFADDRRRRNVEALD